MYHSYLLPKLTLFLCTITRDCTVLCYYGSTLIVQTDVCSILLCLGPASLESGFSRLGWTPIPDFACGVHLASILVSPSMPANEERSPHQMSLLDCSRFKSDIFSELYYFWRDSAITQSNG